MNLARPLMLIALPCLVFGQEEKKPEPKYEMTTYVMGLLRRGPNVPKLSDAESQRIQDGHMANIRKMAETGKLIVAGPFTDNGDLRGVFIFKCTIEEARTLAAPDPAIQSGRLVLELHPWFAAAGLRVDPPKN